MQYEWNDIKSMNSRQLVAVARRDFGLDLGTPDREKRAEYIGAILDAARGAGTPIPGVPAELGGGPAATKPAAKIGASRPTPSNLEEKVELTVGEDYDPDAPKFQAPCVNGVAYQITKGKRVVVPKAIAEALRAAVATIHSRQETSPGVWTEVLREVPRFNVQIHGMVMAPKGTHIPSVTTEEKLARLAEAKRQRNK